MNRVTVLLLAAGFVVALIPTFLAAFNNDQPAPKLGHARIADSVPPVNVWSATPPPPTTTTTQRMVRAAAVSVARFGSGACGGDLPPCSVLACESGGNLTAQNPTSSASGKWQILDSTWNGYAGFQRAMHAPEDVQDAKARELYAGGAGAFHWRSCL